MSELMLLSTLSLLPSLRRRSLWTVAFSGAMAGLATLNKSSGVLLAPVAFCTLSYAAWSARSGARREGSGDLRAKWTREALLRMALWALCAIFGFCILWPAMWVQPLRTLHSVVGLSIEYATAPGDATASFFRGESTQALGLGFYLTTILFRATPLTLLGLLAAVVLMAPRRWFRQVRDKPSRGAAIVLLFFAVTFLLAMASGHKKFDRYMLPVLLAADMAAVFALTDVVELLLSRARWARRRPEVWATVVMLGLLCLQGFGLLQPHLPKYPLAYYNPLAGGPRNAVTTVPVGWGEGLDIAAGYLADLPESSELTVATWAVAGLAPSFEGRVVILTEENLPQADYVLLYIGDVQAGSPLVSRFYGAQEPEFVARLGDVDYAWVYRTTHSQELGELLRARAPDDARIVFNGPSVTARQGLLPWDVIVIAGGDEGYVAGRLATAAAERRYLVYVAYAPRRPHDAYLQRQLGQNALLLWEEPFSLGSVRCYEMLPEADFGPTAVSAETDLDFGQLLSLRGYGLAHKEVQYRQEIGLALQWEVRTEPSQDLHLFMHVLDEQGQRWGQRDIPLVDERSRHTSEWQPGQAPLTLHSVPLEPGLPPGQYWVDMGLYTLEDMQRLDITSMGEDRGSDLRIGPLTVTSPKHPPEVSDLRIPHLVMAKLEGAVEFLGYGLQDTIVESGDTVELTLFWRCLAEMDRDYDIVVGLAGAEKPVVVLREAPAGTGYPTTEWQSGELLTYSHVMTVPQDLASGDYALRLVLCSSEPCAPTEGIELGTLAVWHRERLFAIPDIQHRQSATLGDVSELLGYDLASRAGMPGEFITLTLYWRAQRETDVSYAVFTHLLGDGQVRGQRDGLPQSGDRPTTSWAPGEIIIDTYEIPIDSDAPAGTHRLEVGMYDPTSGERLAVHLDDGIEAPERRILLDVEIDVSSPAK